MVQVLITTVAHGGNHSSTIIAFFNDRDQADEAARRINEGSKSMWRASNYAVVLN